MSKPVNKIYILRHEGHMKKTGTEIECLRELQRLQPHSAIWAMNHDDWTLDARDLVDGVYVRKCDCCDLPMNEGYCMGAGEYYACTDECAKHVALLAYDSTPAELFEQGSDACYYTEWDSSCLCDGDEYYTISQLEITQHTYKEGDQL